MSVSEYNYKIIELTQALVGPEHGTSILSVESKSGWDVQQVFSRWVGSDTEAGGAPFTIPFLNRQALRVPLDK